MLKNLIKSRWLYILILLVAGVTIAICYKKEINWNIFKSDLKGQENWFLKKLHLEDNLNKITTIVIEQKSEKLTIVNQNNNWLILEKDNYLALPTKIKELIFDLADLKIIDSKTANPENFAVIDLKDLESSNDTIKISMFTKNHEEIDSIYLGKREFIANPNANYQNYIYVRRPSENQTWLVAGNLPEGFSFKELVRQPLINLDLHKITGLKLTKTKDPKNVINIKRNITNAELNLLEIPKGYKLKDHYLIDSIMQQFTYLNYEDVIKFNETMLPVLKGELLVLDQQQENLTEKPKEISINFELIYTDSKYYFRLIPTLKDQNYSNWLYKISDYTCQSLLINKADLLEKI